MRYYIKLQDGWATKLTKRAAKAISKLITKADFTDDLQEGYTVYYIAH